MTPPNAKRRLPALRASVHFRNSGPNSRRASCDLPAAFARFFDLQPGDAIVFQPLIHEGELLGGFFHVEGPGDPRGGS